ncbi:LOW QUALITY PROTEIN: hypothetical protein CFC21_100269 [Triticum aestivum]|uniref:BTB domain-containing protein n=2 Tax=Triticum aestivum TaxID=4565 RepID=A0A9R1N2R8_WHEAT|nr:LOW QUALITY PROTEIN: hypothetical protein CFC21_100269 [Triticum aestivum]
MLASERPRTMTSSACIPETAHGAHLFKINRYSLYRDLGVGRLIESSTFTVGGYHWCVLFYPDGHTGASTDHVSAFVELKTKNAKARAVFDLRLVDCRTKPYTLPNPSEIDPSEFESCDDSSTCCGFHDFLKKSELEDYILDDVLVIECNIAVIKLKKAEVQTTKTKFEVQVPRSNLLHNLGNLLETQEGADVSFKVDAEVFPAHKIILAMQSPVFKAEFYGPMKNKAKHGLTIIEDMQPAVFKALLHFIYTDSLAPMDDLSDDEHEEMVKHLLVAADRYAIDRMKLMCESKLCDRLCTENVATTLALADQYHCIQLKDGCIEFINTSNRMSDVVASKGYEHLKRTCPTIVVDIWEKAAKTRKI